MRAILNGLRRVVHWHNVAARLVGFAAGFGLGLSMLIYAGERQPVIVHSAYELDGVSARGGHLDIFFDLDRQRDCPAETSRWLWTWVDHDGVQIKQYFPLTSSATTLTDVGAGQRFILSIPLPSGLWAGTWYYWSKTVEHCSLLPYFFHSPNRETPNIPVQVTTSDPAVQKFGMLQHH